MSEQMNVLPYEAPKKIKFTSTNRDLIFALLILVSVFLCVAWGMFGGWQVGFTVSYWVLFVVSSVYLHRKHKKAGAYSWVCGILSVLLPISGVCTSNEAVRLLCVVGTVLLFWVWLGGLSERRVPQGDLGLFSLWLSQFGKAFSHLTPTMKALFVPENEKKKGVMRGVIGVLCALPVLGIVVPLLVRSDVAFESMLSGLFSDIGRLVGEGVVTLLIVPFVVSYLFSLRHTEPENRETKATKGMEPTFWIAFMSVISVCYVAYLVSQLAYFFSAFSGILPEGYTFSYAEYARRGFFELCGIAAINYALIMLMILFSKKKDGKLSVTLRVFGTFIGLFTLLLIATAISKMVMYIGEYGMTVLRVGTSVFMVALAAVFVTVILRLYSRKIRVFQTALVTFSLALLLLGVGNVNAVVAKYNYDAYISGALESLDIEYMESLGDEGMPYIVKEARENESPEAIRAVDDFAVWNFEYDFEESAQGNALKQLGERTNKRLSELSIPRWRAYAEVEWYFEDTPDFYGKYEDVLTYAEEWEDEEIIPVDPTTAVE